MVKVSCCGLMKDTRSMLKNRKVCYPNGNLMFKATLSPQSVYVPHSGTPPPKVNHYLYCTACFLWSPLIIDSSM